MLIGVFHIRSSWWSYNGIWVTASLLKYSGLFSVFRPILIMQVWRISVPPLISKSLNPLTKPLEIIPSKSVTIGITVIFMFHSYFSSLTRSRYLSLFIAFFDFHLVVGGDCKVHYLAGSFFYSHLVWSSEQD